MFNSRIINIEDSSEAKKEILKVGVDVESLTWLAPKALYYTVKVYGVSSFAANIIKQEMLGKGGDVAVNRGVANCSVDKSDILIMGNMSQFGKLIQKLQLQSGSLKLIADELALLMDIKSKGKPSAYRCGQYTLPIGRKTYIMGILNVTPDSFSDGGSYNTLDAAVKRALEMAQSGADIIDVGGESTRPGHTPVDADEEISRVVPVISALSKELDIPLSIDTSKAKVAQKALEAGACIVNDVWGFQHDENIADVVAKHKAGAVLMHNSEDAKYSDLMGDIISFLKKSTQIAIGAGVGADSIMVDPGIGFGKTTEQNLEVMRKLEDVGMMGWPLLLGTSRKSMIGNVLDLPASDRIEGTAASVALGISKGADVVRVHDIREMKRVVEMSDAMVRGYGEGI